MATITSLLIVLSNLCTKSASASFDPLGRDLATFVTRPELKPPLFNITTHIPDRVTPGYWFYTPYDSRPIEYSPRSYLAAQTGPHIFDNNGNLVWSGALEFGLEGSVSDFKVVSYHGASYLSFIRDPRVTADGMFEGEGIILDPSYSVEKRVRVTGGDGGFNMHEFQVINDGRSVLAETGDRKLVDFLKFGLGRGSGYISDGIFMEIDLATDKEVFRWQSIDHVSPNESYTEQTAFNKAWDYFHMNSVDKNAEGDYLISARYTSCIYKISGKDGSVIWRLGGPNSDFELIGFNFSSQHYARFWKEGGTTSIVSFLNNASDRSKSNNQTANWSSAFLVTLDTTTMKATLTRSWDRPDQKLTRLRGAVQILPNTNVFVSWSDNGYTSEFSMDGVLIQEAQFASKRFVDYRAYKFNFTARPVELPVLKALVYGASSSTITTAIYVSWNGATEVKSWRFYGTDDSSDRNPLLLGTAAKTGFETVLVVAGHVRWVFAEGVAADGKVLGRSTLQEGSVMFNWDSNEATPAAILGAHVDTPSLAPSPEVGDSTTAQGIDLVPTNPAHPVFTNTCIPQRETPKVSILIILPAALLCSLSLAILLKTYSYVQERGWSTKSWNYPFQRMSFTDD